VPQRSQRPFARSDASIFICLLNSCRIVLRLGLSWRKVLRCLLCASQYERIEHIAAQFPSFTHRIYCSHGMECSGVIASAERSATGMLNSSATIRMTILSSLMSELRFDGNGVGTMGGFDGSVGCIANAFSVGGNVGADSGSFSFSRRL
jgi:hypothetical protein